MADHENPRVTLQAPPFNTILRDCVLVEKSIDRDVSPVPQSYFDERRFEISYPDAATITLVFKQRFATDLYEVETTVIHKGYTIPLPLGYSAFPAVGFRCDLWTRIEGFGMRRPVITPEGAVKPGKMDFMAYFKAFEIPTTWKPGQQDFKLFVSAFMQPIDQRKV